jgi:hypothetical protein
MKKIAFIILGALMVGLLLTSLEGISLLPKVAKG